MLSLTKYSKLFSPYKLRNKVVKNRIAMVELVNNYAENHVPTERMARFYAERAKGGVGLIITEGLSVHPTSLPQPHIPTAYEEDNIPKFRMVADMVHEHQTVLLGQLWHVGRQQLWSPTMSPWGVSALPCPLSNSVPHEMTTKEIQEIIDSFVKSAENLQQAGFDGISLHGAHGYLITQFLSPWTNKRKDEYGGSLENRLRFVVQILNQIRERCGEDFIIGIKLTVHEYVEGGLDLEDTKVIIKHFKANCSLDYIAVSQGNFSFSLEYHVPDMHFSETPFIHLAQGIKEVAGDIPVMGMGKITNPDIAERLIAEGKIDIAGMGRSLISDAELPNKILDGKTDEIRECNSCNVCWGEIHASKPLLCIHNPAVGNEKNLGIGTLKEASIKKKVMVIGGGPAGLEAARVAAERGHKVQLFEKDAELGGQLIAGTMLPGRGDLKKTLDYLIKQAKQKGVEIRTNEYIDERKIEKINPDAVIIAAGSKPNLPKTRNSEFQTLSFEDAAKVEEWKGNVIIFDDDGDIPPYSLAEKAAKTAERVTIVTKKTHVAKEVNYVSWIGVNRRLRDYKNIKTITGHKITQFGTNHITIEDVFGGTEEKISCVQLIMVNRNKPNNDLYKKISENFETYNVGDSFAPRKLLASIHEAHNVARNI